MICDRCHESRLELVEEQCWVGCMHWLCRPCARVTADERMSEERDNRAIEIAKRLVGANPITEDEFWAKVNR